MYVVITTVQGHETPPTALLYYVDLLVLFLIVDSYSNSPLPTPRDAVSRETDGSISFADRPFSKYAMCTLLRCLT